MSRRIGGFEERILDARIQLRDLTAPPSVAHGPKLPCRSCFSNDRCPTEIGPNKLATFVRCIELPEAMAVWFLTSLQLKLIKMCVRVVRHASAATFQR